MRSDARSTPWSTFFFALLGLVWCGYVAFPTANPAPCASSGCALFRDSKIAGISLWWVGGAYFFLVSILCLRGSRHLARLLAASALFADALLLLVMFLTAPCFDCLVAAVFIGLVYYTIRSKSGNAWFAEEAARPSLLLPVWFGLFLGNLVLVAGERLPLYAMGNTKSTDIRIFFSPSCPACRGAIHSFGNTAVLYPVLESEDDFDAILRFGAMLKVNVPVTEAIERCRDAGEPIPYTAFYERAALRAQLTRNKAALLRQGFRKLPLIQINGLPGYRPDPLERGGGALPARHAEPSYAITPSLRPAPGGIVPPHDEGAPEFLFDQGPLGQCGGDNPEPCE